MEACLSHRSGRSSQQIVRWRNCHCNDRLLALSRAEWVEHQDPGNGEGSGGGSGGGGDDGPPAPPPNSCPSQDPECWQPLTSEQVALLNHIRLHEFVDSSSTTNPIARQYCREARQRLDQVMGLAGTQGSQLGSGRSDQEPPSQFHHGEYDPVSNRVHIDPMLFDSASSGPNRGLWRRALLAQVLHEISHLNPPPMVIHTRTPYGFPVQYRKTARKWLCCISRTFLMQ